MRLPFLRAKKLNTGRSNCNKEENITFFLIVKIQ